jgi:hypothetical protein
MGLKKMLHQPNPNHTPVPPLQPCLSASEQHLYHNRTPFHPIVRASGI